MFGIAEVVVVVYFLGIIAVLAIFLSLFSRGVKAHESIALSLADIARARAQRHS